MLLAWFFWNGRLGRLAYFGYTMLLAVILAVVATLLIFPLRNSPNAQSVIVMVAVILGAIGLYAGFCLAAKRLHDMDMSAWHYLWMVLVPGAFQGFGSATHNVAVTVIGSLLSLAIGLFLLFWPGTDGPNNYGERA